MKKVLFTLLMFTVMAVGAQAQKSSCAKSCTKTAATGASASTAHCSAPTSAAAKLASTDPSIETRTDAHSGDVCYVRKESAVVNGQETYNYVNVSYDPATNTFVNVSPVKNEGGPSCAPSATAAKGKSSCATSASGKACCAGKSKSASATSATSEGKPIKTSGTN